MIEVEAKIHINGPEEFREKASKLGKYIGKEDKLDDYYTLENIKEFPQKSLRVRKRNNIYEVNFKNKINYIKGVHAKNEEEFQVTDISPFLNLIHEFGFKRWLRKEKTSEIYEIKKDFHIEINNVKNLGWFLEVEYLADKRHIGQARSSVLKIIKELGIDKKDIIEEGYTKMLWGENKLGI